MGTLSQRVDLQPEGDSESRKIHWQPLGGIGWTRQRKARPSLLQRLPELTLNLALFRLSTLSAWLSPGPPPAAHTRSCCACTPRPQ